MSVKRNLQYELHQGCVEVLTRRFSSDKMLHVRVMLGELRGTQMSRAPNWKQMQVCPKKAQILHTYGNE